jgi:hypothetical protein
MTRKTSARRNDASAGEVLTYQDVLDEAIEETFPASDPIAPAVANAGPPVSTRRNPTDWKLEHRTTEAGPRPRPTPKARATKPASDTHEPDASAELDAIYRALKRGVAREEVNDANVDALIDLAHERGDTKLEVLLREWRSACGDDPDMPPTS